MWSETFWKSFQAGYIKNLDLSFYLSLDNAIARRLYRFLDKWMHYRNECEIDIFDLVGRLGMVRYKYPSEAKKKLKPAFDELIKQGYLADVEVYKKGKYTRVRFTKQKVHRPTLWDTLEDSANEQQVDQVEDTSASQAAPVIDEWDVVHEQYETSEELNIAWVNTLLDSCEMNIFQI